MCFLDDGVGHVKYQGDSRITQLLGVAATSPGGPTAGLALRWRTL